MKPTLLIVDDEWAICRLLQFYFDKQYNVVTMTDSKDALAWLQSNKAEAIIADLQMPTISGKDIIRSVRAQKKNNKTPFIILSGSDTTNDRIECLEIGADDYMVKPFNPKELEIRLNVINKRNQK
ncbi:MAG: response regulator transcription factor [Bacteroidota bacterium]|nr:response regulator transcription factor [Bacteroidota bacterium]